MDAGERNICIQTCIEVLINKVEKDVSIHNLTIMTPSWIHQQSFIQWLTSIITLKFQPPIWINPLYLIKNQIMTLCWAMKIFQRVQIH